jgi:hypothetical protein
MGEGIKIQLRTGHRTQIRQKATQKNRQGETPGGFQIPDINE